MSDESVLSTLHRGGEGQNVYRMIFPTLVTKVVEEVQLPNVMVSVLVPRASGLGSSPGRGHCVVFLGQTLNSDSASLHPGV